MGARIQRSISKQNWHYLLRRIVALSFCFASLSTQMVTAAGCDTTSDVMLVSVKTGGAPVSEVSGTYNLSDDARYIVFDSDDGTIVANDTNNAVDTFIHDRLTCTTTLVSRTPSGIPGMGDGYNTFQVHISGNGRYVLFESDHTNLVANDAAGFRDVFLYDHHDQSVVRISNGLSGAEANGRSHASHISADGRYLLFLSEADNIVPGDTNEEFDVFLLDRNTNIVERVSVNSNEEQANAQSWYGEVSNDGRYIAFISFATNLSPLDTTASRQKAFLRDRQAGTTTLVSVNADGEPANGQTPVVFLSDDLQNVGMLTEATNFDESDTNGVVDGYVRDLTTSETTWVTPRAGTDWAYAWAMSTDGRYVATEGNASLSAADSNGIADTYLYDMQTGISTLQSRTPTGQAGDDYSIYPFLTPDARFMLFLSSANNLTTEIPTFDRNLYLARVTLPSGSLDVEVGLQGRPTVPHPDWVTSVRVVIVPQGSITPVYDEVVETDENGAFTIPELNYGIYTVWVKGANTLAVSQSITLAADSLPVSVNLLPAGDANGDNIVSLTDFSILASSFGTQFDDANYDARADFNGDDLVTLPDFSLLASNFATTGHVLPG